MKESKKEYYSICEGYKDIFHDNGLNDFHSIYDIQSEEYYSKNPIRNVVKISLGKESFFVKRHKEQGMLMPKGPSPAKMEWQNVERLRQSGFHTMEPVAYGEKMVTNRTRCSFIITKGIKDAISLERYLLEDLLNDNEREKIYLIKALAILARQFHGSGYCHQDFYSGHIFIQKKDLGYDLCLIDLQRVFWARKLRDRWRIKDLSQLNYSVQKNIISKANKIKFLDYYLGYTGLDRRKIYFINKIRSKTRKISRHTERLIKRGTFEKSEII